LQSCGLKLDAIAAELAEQRPSAEYAELHRRRKRFETLGLASLGVFALIALMMLLSKIFYYKLVLLGPEALFWSATAAMIAFGLLSVFFFNYPKLVMKMDNVNPRLPADKDLRGPVTNKLLNDTPVQPASVTEHSTELLKNRR
jgi:hypothetical protein